MEQLTLESLGPLQRSIMEVLWAAKSATVHEVLAQLSTSKPLAYTSVLSCLQKLEKLGWVQHQASGRTYVYQPTMSRDDVRRGSLRNLLEGVFGGSSTQLFQKLLDENLSDEDLAELQRMIDRKRGEGGV